MTVPYLNKGIRMDGLKAAAEGVRGSAANDSETKDRIPPGVPNTLKVRV